MQRIRHISNNIVKNSNFIINNKNLHFAKRRYSGKEIVNTPPSPPISPPSNEFNRDIGKADRIYHPFDTYKFVRSLEACGYSQRVSEVLMVATR